MFNFEHSQINKQDLEHLAEIFLKHFMVYVTSKFDVGKTYWSLHLPLKLDAVLKKKQCASEVPTHLQDKLNRHLDILEQYEFI